MHVAIISRNERGGDTVASLLFVVHSFIDGVPRKMIKTVILDKNMSKVIFSSISPIRQCFPGVTVPCRRGSPVVGPH
jgi:hypothetical protein